MSYGALRWATLLVVLLCSLQASAQNLTGPCNPPGFTTPNATGYATLPEPFLVPNATLLNGSSSQFWNLSTAIFAPPSDATSGNLTQRFWLTAGLPEVDYAVIGGCMILLDDFPANSSLNTAGEKTPYGACSALPGSCITAAAAQLGAYVDASIKGGQTGGFCGEALATPPAQCNGSYAWGSVKAVQYLNNTGLYDGNATCDGAAPLTGSAQGGWLLEDSAPVNASTGDTLAAWRQRSRPIFLTTFTTHPYGNESYNQVDALFCLSATSEAAGLVMGAKALGLLVAFWTVWAVGIAY